MPPGKVVHFIWAGGDEPKLDPLIAWNKSNPGCELVLWVDNKSVSSGKSDELKKHQVTVKDISEQTSLAAPPVQGVVGYMLQPPRPNYGASSDLVRYALLTDLGGLYVDSDVAPPKNGGNDVYISTAMQPYASALVKAVSAAKK